MDLSAIGRQFGLNDEQTRAALEALTPVVAAGVRRNAQSPEGLQDILSSVLTGGRARALEDENAVQFENAKSSGDEILGQIFGSKDVSREVTQQLSATSGVGASILKKLLPIVAAVVMGQVANSASSLQVVVADLAIFWVTCWVAARSSSHPAAVAALETFSVTFWAAASNSNLMRNSASRLLPVRAVRWKTFWATSLAVGKAMAGRAMAVLSPSKSRQTRWAIS